MAEEQDPKLSAAYRALGAEEPPRTLDEAILAAARRRPKSWTQRWAVPLSLAAVVVLSVVVTLRIQHEQPGIESPERVAREAVKAPPKAPQPAPAAQESPQLKAESQFKPAPRKPPAPFQPAPDAAAVASVPAAVPASAPAPVAATAPTAVAEETPASRRDAASAAESSVAGPRARISEERLARDAEAAARAPQVGPLQALSKRPEPMAAAAPGAPPVAAAKLAPETPERELERIAQLRRDGRHDEADKALAEFRKRYPDYRIAPPMLERVERR